MSYRTYVAKLDKVFSEKIRECKTKKEFTDVVKEHFKPIAEKEIENGIEPAWRTAQNLLKRIHEEDGPYIPIFFLGEELYEFGKESPAYESVYNEKSAKLFSPELEEYYEEYGAVIINEKIFLDIIEWYRQKIIDYYKELTTEKYVNKWYPEMTREQALMECANDHLFWWEEFGALNLNKDDVCICHSWMYEHAIFELVRIYKTFDWVHDTMVFYGY